MTDLKGKTAIITGASRGIGAAILQTFGNAGAKVVGTATADAGISLIQQQLNNGGFDGAATQYDAAKPEQAKTLTEFATEYFGGAPDIVVCNAGTNADGLLMRMKDEDWTKVIAANLNGVFHLSRAVVGGMIKKRAGRIIAVSSVVASSGNPGQTHYCASKAGVEGFVRALAREIGGRHVTVNAVAPGFIATDMTDKLSDDIKKRLTEQIPLGRIGNPEEIAAAVLFLASDNAAYVTGQTLHVNGGLYMG